jgi:hypothetical protein
MDLRTSRARLSRKLLSPFIYLSAVVLISACGSTAEPLNSTENTPINKNLPLSKNKMDEASPQVSHIKSKQRNTTKISDEHIRVAKGFAAALNSQDVDSIADFFDMGDFGTRIGDEIETETNIKQALLKQYRTSAFARTFAQSSFILPVGQEGTFGFKGTVDTEEFGTRPIIRLDYESGGHEFILLFLNDSNKIADLFYATKGNLVSKSVAGTTQMILPAQNRYIARLVGEDGNANVTLKSFQKMIKLREQGRFSEVLEVIKSFPETMQASRSIIDFEILIAQNVGEVEYIDALSNLNKYYGDDPSTSFMLVDYHVTVEQNDAAMQSVEQAMAFWGEDAALYNLKANMYFLLDDLVAAVEAAKRAIQLEPEFEDSYWTLVALQDLTQDFKGLTSTFADIRARFNPELTPQMIAESGAVANYPTSDEFKDAVERNSFIKE